MSIGFPFYMTAEFKKYEVLRSRLIDLQKRELLKQSDFQNFCYEVIALRSYEASLLIRKMDGITNDRWISLTGTYEKRLDKFLINQLHTCDKYIDTIRVYVETMQMCLDAFMPKKYLSVRKFIRSRCWRSTGYMRHHNINLKDVLPETKLVIPLSSLTSIDKIIGNKMSQLFEADSQSQI